MGAGAAGAAVAAAIAQAIKASGTIVEVSPQDFARLLERQTEPLVVVTQGGVFRTTYQYLTSYKGLAFHARSRDPIYLPSHCEIVAARKIWVP